MKDMIGTARSRASMLKQNMRWSVFKNKWETDRREIIKTVVFIFLTLLFAPMIVGFFNVSIESVISGQSQNVVSCWISGIKNHLFATLLLGIVVNLIIWIVLEILRDDTTDIDHRNVQTTDAGTYGTARFMTLARLRDILQTGRLEDDNMKGPLFGKVIDGDPDEYVTLPSDKKEKAAWGFNNHVLLIGGSGAGKTVTFLINHLTQMCRRGESVFLSDPKGEMYEKTAGMFEKNGYAVHMFATKRDYMRNSDRFNMLDGICRFKVLTKDGELLQSPIGHKYDDDDEIIVNPERDLDITLAEIVTKAVLMMQPSEKDSFWDRGDVLLLRCLILFYASDPARIRSRTANLASIADDLSVGGISKVNEIGARISKHHPAYKDYQTIINASKDGKAENLGNIVMGLSLKLTLFGIPDVAKMTQTTDFDIEGAAKQKTIFYVVMEDQNRTFDFLSQVFFKYSFGRIIEYADRQPSKRCDIPVNFVFEEAANIGEIQDLPRAICTVRSRGVSVTLAFQSKQQIKNTYLGNEETIVANCNTKVFIRPDDVETNKWIEELTGVETVVQRSDKQTIKTVGESLNFHPTMNHSEGEGKRNVINQDEARRMDGDKLLVIMTGENPFYAEKVLYVEHFFYQQNQVPKLLAERIPEWQLAEMDRRARNDKSDRENCGTWRYFPKRKLWYTVTGDLIENSEHIVPKWNIEDKLWFVEDQVLAKQLNPPILNDSLQLVFQENPDLLVPITTQKQFIPPKRVSSKPPLRKNNPPQSQTPPEESARSEILVGTQSTLFDNVPTSASATSKDEPVNTKVESEKFNIYNIKSYSSSTEKERKR